METINLSSSRNMGVFVWQSGGSQPDAEGVLARFALPLPATKAICHYAAFQRHDPMGVVCDKQMIGGAMNRVQGLRITRWAEAIEGGVFAVLELAEGGWLVLLPIAGRESLAWLAPLGDAVTLKVGTLGTAPVSGELPVLAWARASSVYQACRLAWQSALSHPLLRGLGRLRVEKSYPEIFTYLGWCSWEQYQRSITADLLVDAVRDIHRSDLPVRWVLVDDGYYYTMPEGAKLSEYPLRRLAPAEEKFPNGWRTVVAERRADGVRWFGLWQNFNGYWARIAADNELGTAVNEKLMDVPAGGRLPNAALSDATVWFETMLGVARAAGFDFVKVDDQARSFHNYRGTANPVAAATVCGQALERAAAAQSNGLINCMAHGPVNTFNTCLSAVTRCSEDYLLNDAWRAKAHLHNSYQNMLWLGPTVWGDHDMFHSSDRMAGRIMAVSKALSGGPVYLSDAPRDFQEELIRPLCFGDGKLLRPLAPSVPLPRCVTLDPFEQAEPYLVGAPLPNGVAAVVAYNLTEPTRPVTGTIGASDYIDAAGLLDRGPHQWPEADEGLVLYDWPRGTARRLEGDWSFTLDGFADCFLLLSPIRCGWAVIGRTDKYLSPAGVEVLDVTNAEIVLRVMEEGPIAVWRDDRLAIHHAAAGTVRVSNCRHSGRRCAQHPAEPVSLVWTESGRCGVPS
ncbi:MAG: Sip1-related alpha-galactosidase [Spartobacteria bacterium]